MKNVLVMGGGIGGLSAGLMLSRTGKFQVTVIEKESVLGGLCGTFQYKDFSLDYGAHKSYSILPGILDEFVTLMGQDAIKHKKKNSIYIFNQYLNYPIKIMDLILKMGFKNFVKCSTGTIKSIFNKFGEKTNLDTYEKFVIDKFGKELYQLVFESLADKVWGNPGTLSSDIAKTRIPSSNIMELLFRVVGLKKESAKTDAEYFYYPKSGFGSIIQKMGREIIKNRGEILLNTTAQQFILKNNQISSVFLNSQGKQLMRKIDIVVSSINLDSLIKLFPEGINIFSKNLKYLINNLEYRSLILVYLFLKKEKITDNHWIFFPGKDLIFSRIFEQKNMDSDMVPRGKTAVCCDFTDYDNGSLYSKKDSELAKICISDLEKVGLIEADCVEEFLVKRYKKFYPRYSVNYKDNLKKIFGELLKVENLLLTGRIGFYNYNNADHCLDMGKYLAEELLQNKPHDVIMTNLAERVDSYRIVD